MIYIDKYNIIFIHLTKTGGESVLAALPNSKEAVGNSFRTRKRHIPVSAILDESFLRKYSDQLDLLPNIRRDGDREFKPGKHIHKIQRKWNSLRITFVRNPWARLVSEYHYNIAKGEEPRPFEDVVYSLLTHRDDIWKWSQMRWLCHKGKCYADRVYRLEYDKQQFESDFNVKLPHKNKSIHNPYREYYDDRTKRIVELVYADDIKEFGYEF